MKIAVLNGSPKGDFSVTLQYVKYIQKHVQEHEFTVFNISRDIKKIEENKEYIQRIVLSPNTKTIEKTKGYFQRIIESVKESEGVIWAFPVYHFHVPAQYKQFIELIFERKAEEVFKGKYATVLMTSAHFYDNLAADYMHGICDDLSMRYTGEFSAEMNDLIRPDIRKQLLTFADYFFHSIYEQIPTPITYQPISANTLIYTPKNVQSKPKNGKKRIALLSDEMDEKSNLSRMIEVFIRSMPNSVSVFNIHEIGMDGGCFGCLHCGYDHECVHTDSFKNFFDQYVLTADAVVFAGTIKDRFLSSTWRLFFDRTSVYGLCPILTGKQIGFLISGPLSQVPNLQETLKAYAQMSSQHPVVDIITDEYDSSDRLTSVIQGFVGKLMWVVHHELKLPRNFYGHAGYLVLRDLVYLLRGVYAADHCYYKRHGFYNFPQKKLHRQVFNIFLALANKIPQAKKYIQAHMKEFMVRKFQKIVENK